VGGGGGAVAPAALRAVYSLVRFVLCFTQFKILFAIITFIISDENANQVFSQIHVRISYLFFAVDMGFCLVAQPWTYKKIGGPS
jgi:TRAP-type C4-dicarboxylate transport system permease small subunit